MPVRWSPLFDKAEYIHHGCRVFLKATVGPPG